VIPSAPVTYDDRFLQISTNLFNTLANCTDLAPCAFDVNQTTLSAHSYDYVITGLSSGNYGHQLGTEAWKHLLGPCFCPADLEPVGSTFFISEIARAPRLCASSSRPSSKQPRPNM
jgi:hypothetical protein